MNALEILKKYIELLENSVQQIDASKTNEKARIEEEMKVIKSCQEALDNEELMINYDFTRAIELMEAYNFNIENLAKVMNDIKNALDVKRELDLPNMSLSEKQTVILKKFREGLATLQLQLQKKLEEILKSSDDDKKLKDLEDLAKVLEGTGRRKYITADMFESLYEVIDWEKMTTEEAKELLSGIYEKINLQGQQNKEIVDFDDVLKVYSSYLNPDEFAQKNGRYTGLFACLLQKHELEIKTSINIKNTREILQFFKDNNILQCFGRNALLKISLFGKLDYIKELYNKIKTQHPEELEMYFEDEAATLWVCDKKINRKNPFRVSRNQEASTQSLPSLYSQCHSVTDEEFRENVMFLNDNSDLFDEKYDIANFGAHLKAKTISSDELAKLKMLLNLVTRSGGVLKKNIGLCRLFGFGMISKIPVSCLEFGDIEAKMHLAIELGLLNPPMSQAYLEMEKDIIRSEEFKKIIAKKKLYNQSIRNYFQRYASYLSRITINEYAYLAYKLQELGQLEFYNEFFSDRKAGQKSVEFLTDKERETTSSRDKMDQLVSEQFLTENYPEHISRYSEYDEVISDYVETDIKLKNLEGSYYDQAILDEKLIQKLEKEHRVMDKMTQNGTLVDIPNEFIYLFEGRIISRYKVLHNATVLKEKYGYLDEEMLLTAIVRNSFLNKEEFMRIKDSIKERDKSL